MSSSSSQSRPASGTTGGASSHTARVESEDKLFKDAAMALSLVAASVLVLRALAASMTLYVSLLPLLYVYGLQTCPPATTFDAKRELRSVLRGDALPADHPDKPKSGLASFVAGAVAAVTSELATLPGYEVSMWSLAGAAWIATVTLPTSDLACVWIGCNHRWYYWGSRRLTPEVVDAGSATHRVVPETTANFTIGNTKVQLDFGKKSN